MYLSHWLALMYVLYKTAVSQMYIAFLSSPEFSRRLLENLTLEAANLKQEWPLDPRLWLSEVRAFLIVSS